jgi:phenylacetate-CoA ligase
MRLLKLLPRFKHAYQTLELLAQREEWPRTQIEVYQLHKLNALWRHAIHHVPYYRHLCRTLHLPGHFLSLAEFKETVPLLKKSLVRDNPQQFLSDYARPGCWERTSGSTGAPTRIYHDAVSHRAMQHAKYRLYQRWGVDILDRSAYLWDRADFVLSGWQGLLKKTRLNLVDALRSRLRLSAFQLNKQSLSSYLREIERFRPSVLYGFSNAIYQLAQAAVEQGFSCQTLKAVVMTSEPATQSMRTTVETAFGVPAVIEYGATECELIAGSQPDGTLQVREDLVHIETLPHKSGGFEFAVTVLVNASFPLFRYQIEDLTDCPLSLPSRGFAVLRGGVGGRQDDLLQTRSGGYVHPSGIDAFFEHVWDSCSIRRYRVHQRRCGTLDMQIEIDPDRGRALDLPRMASALSRLVEGFPVHIDLTHQLAASTAAKHRAITSDLVGDHLLANLG